MKLKENVPLSIIQDNEEYGQSKFNSLSSKRQQLDAQFGSPSQDVNLLISDSANNTVQQIIQKDDKDSLEQNLENRKYLMPPEFEISENQPSIVNQQSSERNKMKTFFMSQKSIKTIKNVKNSLKLVKKPPTMQSEKNNVFINLKLIAQIKVKVIYFFKKFTASGRNLLLRSNKKIRRAINDKSDYGQLQVKRTLKLLFSLKNTDLEDSSKQQDSRFMISPNSFINLLFLIIFSTMNILMFLLLSIMMIFYGPSDQEYYINITFASIWGLQILIELNTQLYEQTFLINKRRIVFILYLRKRAFFDIVPILFITAQPSHFVMHKIFQVITFMKLNNVYNDINLLQKYLCMTVKNYYIIQLFNLIVKIFILGHIIACLWYLVGQMEINFFEQEKTWYDESMGSDLIWWKLYLESMYWALTLMTTGSNVAKTIPELFFTTFIMLFTTIIFGYMLNTTGIILSQLDQQDENKRIDLNIINDYMRSNKISKTLQGRVNQDLEHYYLYNLQKEQEENQQVLKKISPHLNRLLKLEHSHQFIEKIQIFEKKFSKETVDEICLELEEEYFTPNQWLFKEDQYSNQSLMYIVQGSVELVKSCSANSSEQKIISRLQKGSLLGQVTFFTGLSYDCSARSCEFTKIVRISRDKFLQIISKTQKDHEIFCTIRDKQAIYEEYSVTQSKCFFCNCTTHLSTDCHLVHLQRSQFLQKVKIDSGKSQIRSLFERKKNQSNSYFIRKDIERQIQKYMWNHRRDQKIQSHRKRIKTNEDSMMDSEYSDQFSHSQVYISSNYSSENYSEDSDLFSIKLKNQEYFENGRSIKQIQRLQLLNHFKKTKKESQDNIQTSQAQLKPSTQKINIPLNSASSLQNYNFKDFPLIYENGKFRNGWFIQEEETTHTRTPSPKVLNGKYQREQNQSSQTTIITDRKRSSKQYYQEKRIEKKQKSNIYFESHQHQGTQELDHRKQKAKSQIVKHQHSFPIPLQMDDEKDKEKRISYNTVEFEIMKDWSYYFPQGNYKIIITKYHRYLKKKKGKQAIYSTVRPTLQQL